MAAQQYNQAAPQYNQAAPPQYNQAAPQYNQTPNYDANYNPNYAQQPPVQQYDSYGNPLNAQQPPVQQYDSYGNPLNAPVEGQSTTGVTGGQQQPQPTPINIQSNDQPDYGQPVDPNNSSVGRRRSGNRIAPDVAMLMCLTCAFFHRNWCGCFLHYDIDYRKLENSYLYS